MFELVHQHHITDSTTMNSHLLFKPIPPHSCMLLSTLSSVPRVLQSQALGTSPLSHRHSEVFHVFHSHLGTSETKEKLEKTSWRRRNISPVSARDIKPHAENERIRWPSREESTNGFVIVEARPTVWLTAPEDGSEAEVCCFQKRADRW